MPMFGGGFGLGFGMIQFVLAITVMGWLFRKLQDVLGMFRIDSDDDDDFREGSGGKKRGRDDFDDWR